MKGEGDCSEQHFLPSIFEMSTSLRPTVKFSDSEKTPTYLIIITSCQVFKKSRGMVVFLSKLHRLTSPPASARAQTPAVMISVTESGNYWTFLFMPLARSDLTHPHTPTRSLSPFTALTPPPPSRHPAEQTALVPSGEPCHQNYPKPTGLVLHQQKLEVSPESGAQWSCHLLRAWASYLWFKAGGATVGANTATYTFKAILCLQTMVRQVYRDMMKLTDCINNCFNQHYSGRQCGTHILDQLLAVVVLVAVFLGIASAVIILVVVVEMKVVLRTATAAASAEKYIFTAVAVPLLAAAVVVTLVQHSSDKAL